MRNRAKAYKQFILEAYIDDSGELQDFNSPSNDDYDVKLIDEAQRIQEFIEDLGANDVHLTVREPYIRFTFIYGDYKYYMGVDLDNGTVRIYTDSSEIYADSMESFIDVVNANGLDFLNY